MRLRIKVTVELLGPGETCDLMVLDAGVPTAAALEREVLEKAKQLLAVASHSLKG